MEALIRQEALFHGPSLICVWGVEHDSVENSKVTHFFIFYGG